MLIETAFAANLENIAKALRAGVFAASKDWLKVVRVYAMQNRPEEGTPAYASARVLSAPFTFRIVLNGNEREAGVVHTLDEIKLARGVARLASIDPASFARIAEGNAEPLDGVRLLQFALWGAVRFDAKPVVKAAAKPRIAAKTMADILAGMKERRK